MANRPAGRRRLGQVRRLLGGDGIAKGLRYSEQRAGEAVIRVHAPSAKAAEPGAPVEPPRSRAASLLDGWRTLRSWHGPLAWFAAAMLVLTAVAAVGYVVDSRMLVGQPIWGKPLKFALSFVAYAVTLAWMLGKLQRGRRIGWWAGTTVTVASALEMTAIVGQVVRGRQSH